MFKKTCRYQNPLKISLLRRHWKGGRSRTGLGGSLAAADTILLPQHTLLKQQQRDPSKAFLSGVYCSFPQGKQLENPMRFAHFGNPDLSTHICTDYFPSCQGTAGAGGSPGTMGAPCDVRQGRAWQQWPVPWPQPGAGQPGGIREDPALGHRAPPWEQGQPEAGQ